MSKLSSVILFVVVGLGGERTVLYPALRKGADDKGMHV